MDVGSAVLYVVDLPSMATFYSNVFGLTPIAGDHGDVWQEFQAGGFRLGLHAIPRDVLDSLQPGPSVTPRERNPIKLVFTVPDVEHARTRLETLGVRVVVRPWGGCDVVDPEGNIFGLIQATP
jgi:predicted enzyme related to lactoylglutathione lyase